jgi:hypothetical protein
VLSLILFI